MSDEIPSADSQSIPSSVDEYQSPFDKKVDSIATVLDEFPPMQVLKAIEQLAEDQDSLMEGCDIATTASNVATDEELKRVVDSGEEL